MKKGKVLYGKVDLCDFYGISIHSTYKEAKIDKNGTELTFICSYYFEKYLGRKLKDGEIIKFKLTEVK